MPAYRLLCWCAVPGWQCLIQVFLFRQRQSGATSGSSLITQWTPLDAGTVHTRQWSCFQYNSLCIVNAVCGVATLMASDIRQTTGLEHAVRTLTVGTVERKCLEHHNGLTFDKSSMRHGQQDKESHLTPGPAGRLPQHRVTQATVMAVHSTNPRLT